MYIKHRDFTETKEFIDNMNLAKRRFNVFYICVVLTVNTLRYFSFKK